MAGLEPAFVDVDGQRHDGASVEAGVGEGEHGEVQLAQVEGEVVEESDADVALLVDVLVRQDLVEIFISLLKPKLNGPWISGASHVL